MLGRAGLNVTTNGILLFSCLVDVSRALLRGYLTYFLYFFFKKTVLILIYTKIRLHLATVCPSGPCIELPVFFLQAINSRKFGG